MEADAPARGGPELTDVLGLVAMQGQADIVARVGLGLNRFTRSDADLWRACINVVFGKTKMGEESKYEFESNARTRLMAYLDRGRADLVELALGYGADPNLNIIYLHEEIMWTIRTPLQCAIVKKTYSLVRLLLEHGADPNRVFSSCTYRESGTTPLELASETSFPMVQLLVEEHGVKVPGAFPLGEVVPLAKIQHCQPLFSAIKHNNLSMMRYFVGICGVRLNYLNSLDIEWSDEKQEWVGHPLWGGGNAVIDEDNFASYLDYVLSKNGADINIEMVTYLLDAGATVNFVDSETSDSPLLLAVNHQRMDVVTLLLARGADPNLAGDWDHESPIIAAAKNNDLQMASALVGAGGTVLAFIHYEEFNPNAYGHEIMVDWGLTALHHFAEHHNSKGIALMVREGAEIDAVTFSDLTPLLLVAQAVGEDASAKRIAAACKCCQLLFDAGADVNYFCELPEEFDEFDGGDSLDVRKRSRFSALTYATELNAPSLVSCLVDLGADITHCTEHSFSLLMRAAYHGHVEVLEILVKAAQALPQEEKATFLDQKFQDEGDLNNDWNGRNALHFCLFVAGNKAQCAKILIAAGVSCLMSP